MGRGRKPKTGPRSTQQLLGIQEIRDEYISTPMGDLVFYIVKPTNTSVMPAQALTQRIKALRNVIQAHPVEMMAIHSRDSFTANKSYYRERIAQEENEEIRRLLQEDYDHLEDIRALSVLAREFCFVLRIKDQRGTRLHSYLSSVEQSMASNGFTVRRASKEDMKRMLAIYFTHDVTSERYPEFDGQQHGGDTPWEDS